MWHLSTLSNIYYTISPFHSLYFLHSSALVVSGIGKKSAEYMQEFLETGTLQKLQEKKAGMM